jgi:hypothetical protein
MAPARDVLGIKPKRSLRENAQRVIETRLGEFLDWQGALSDERLVSDLHNMRIAAKRLRYALEMFEICIQEPKPLLKELTSNQEDLGEIHDLDVLAGVLRARLAEVDATTEEEAVRIMAETRVPRMERSLSVRRLLATSARNPRRVGVVSLLASTIAERGRRYARFQARYAGERLDGFARRVSASQNRQSEVLSSDENAPERTDVERQNAIVHPDTGA